MYGMARQVWQAVRPVEAGQWLWWWCGTLLLVSATVHGAIALAGGGWDGPVSWRKPVLFAESFALLDWTLVWVLRQLPRRWWVATGAWLIGSVSVLETVLITAQRWRGQPSHFNADGPVNAVIWSVMGVSVAVLALGTLVLLVSACLRFRGSATARVGVLAGLAAVLVAGYVGKDMAALGEQAWDATGQVPAALHFGAAGSAKLAHAVGLHAAQVLALLAIGLEAARLPGRTRIALSLLGVVAYAALLGGLTATAYAGRPWSEPALPMAVLIATGLLGLSAVAAVAVAGLWATRGVAGSDEFPGGGGLSLRQAAEEERDRKDPQRCAS